MVHQLATQQANTSIPLSADSILVHHLERMGEDHQWLSKRCLGPTVLMAQRLEADKSGSDNSADCNSHVIVAKTTCSSWTSTKPLAGRYEQTKERPCAPRTHQPRLHRTCSRIMASSYTNAEPVSSLQGLTSALLRPRHATANVRPHGR